MNWRRVVAGCIVVFAAIQFVPVDRSKPPVVDPIVFSSPDAERIARQSCYDCHSNENVWPWYGHIAPVSWIVAHHIEEGRSVLNFSDIAGTLAHGGERGEAGEAGEAGAGGSASEIVEESAETINEGEMPPAYYLLTHPDATLTAADKATLIAGIQEALANR
jgi:hypothetical protein